MTTYTTLWIDHREARIIRIDENTFDERTLGAPHHIHRRHPKGESGAKEHPDDAKRFFRDVVRSLEGSSPILLVGPGSAKLDFFRYLHAHERTIESRVVGLETVDHPTDRQLAAHARAYFKLAPQRDPDRRE